MTIKPFGLIIVLVASTCLVLAQDYFSYGGGNFSGLNQVISNPATAADNRLKVDIHVTGLEFNFNNSWFKIKRPMLNYEGSVLKPSTVKFPGTWQNLTPNVADNVFKNFVFIQSPKTKALILENRILLPSLLYQINSKNSLAFTWSMRQIANADGFSPAFAHLFEKELDFSVTQNNRNQNKNLALLQMSWVEHGFTYARVLSDKNKHFVKAGITPKLLKGLESIYLLVRDLDFMFSTKDTSSYFNADFSYAHSGNLNTLTESKSPLKDFYKSGTPFKLGLDIGFVYEWRPYFSRYQCKPDGKNSTWRKDQNKYKLKVGASVVDIGRITFTKEGSYYDLTAKVRRQQFDKFTSLKGANQFDSLLKSDFSYPNPSDKFSVLLPTAINTQVDYSINRFFYLNLSAHITGFYKSNFYKVHNYTAVCFAPRIEHYWFDVSVPFTFNTLSANRFQQIMVGLNIRLGPLCFGSNNLGPLFKGDVANYNFYGLLKVAIPYKRLHDRDKDGVIDKKDECPDDPGVAELSGCPDKDGDKVPDKRDACPNQPGVALLLGCPDTDGDGIRDADDLCPKEKGSLVCKGCPDSDNDSIVDKEDVCPDKKGIKKFKGCPDSDKDGIHDGEDACPKVVGPKENKGCPWPDTDKDGIIDKLDSCITVFGLPEHKGCPPPLKLEAAEKKIIEKAFANLEFASGKETIKPTSYPSLNALADLLLKHSDNWKLKLSGHTDNSGTKEDNMLLSEKRTKAVQKYLAQRGVPVQNIIIEWFGQSRPVADNLNEKGRQKNRRVEMKVLPKE